MTDNETTTVEEARKCAKCGKPGAQVATSATMNQRRQRVTVHTFKCETELCPWFETTWIVQVNPDGTVPIAKPGPKSFPDLTPSHLAMGQRVLEDIKQEDLRGE